MINAVPKAFWDELLSELGADAIDHSPATIADYGANLMPSGDRMPGGVLYPASTAQVQQMVQAANRHRVAIWPISTGRNVGIGEKSPVREGQVVMHLGRRMNHIHEIDETLCFAEIDPGVTFRQLYDELGRRGHRLMMSSTSGPTDGSLVGNAIDKGAGYTPYFDHFGMTCGLEVVLGDGRILRTADGASPGAKTWHLVKYGFGPFLDGLFVQSNFGIVTRAGLWLMPRPPVIRCFIFSFPDDDDFGEIVDLIRPLKLNNFVPTLFKVTNDVYSLGTVETYPYGRTGGKTPLPDEVRGELRRQHGIGSWTVSGAFYGDSEETIRPLIERVRKHFERSGKARYTSHEQALESRIFKIHVDTFSGTPTEEEMPLHEWRPGGGSIWFLPSTPMVGSIANQHQRMSRSILARYGFEFITEYVCTGRVSRALHPLIFNRQDPDEARRAAECYRALMQAYAEAGYPISRAPIEVQEEAMARLQVTPEVCRDLKRALDPNGVIAPGKYGIV
ncbi:MAG: FAD-binding oxidoreductase [Candidatus Binataceae bacterium]|nr:FAD-binding oxidoreductase [Candidatus Binataceae bacterium]